MNIYPTEEKTKQSQSQTNISYETITGEILYNMTNDYMFRAVLQKNKKVLTGLVCSLLHLTPSDIKSLEITNPIELGSSITDKEFWLDVNVLPVIHIGFLSFTLFPESPEFYATYQFQNVKNQMVYSDKLQLRVVELNHINLATEEDKLYGLDYWAYLFKAKTWEELKVMATKNEYLEETSKTLYALGSDARIREECRRRNDYVRQMNYYETTIATQDATIAEQATTIKEQNARIAELEALLAAKQ